MSNAVTITRINVLFFCHIIPLKVIKSLLAAVTGRIKLVSLKAYFALITCTNPEGLAGHRGLAKPSRFKYVIKTLAS
jgi:hypothetical protein